MEKHSNTLSVAATGFGKTVCLSAVAENIIDRSGGRALIVAHRDELTRQNSETLKEFNRHIPISFFTADQKSWRGRVIFSMIQTLSQEKNLCKMPPVDLVIYDEAHHAASNSYRRLTARARELRSDVKFYGVTATPARSDRRGLRDTFTNIGDIVYISELVQTGFLVPPKAMVIDIGTQEELKAVKKTANDYDMAEVEAIQNSAINNHQIVAKWMELASDRPSVAFCATIKHSMDVRDAFKSAGVDAEAIHSEMPMGERRAILAAFDRGEIPVICNPLILTEGWDSPLCSCIMLLRSSSHKSTMIQMIGRGLRKLDPVKNPGVRKRDCLVLDFGISLLNHGDIDSTVKLSHDKVAGEAPTKTCPECFAEVPIQSMECALCGYEFQVFVGEDGYHNQIEEFRLVEIDLINKSPFRWVSIFPSEKVLITQGFDYWAAVVSTNDDDWFAIGGGKGMNPALLGLTNKIGTISTADDFMRKQETNSSAKKVSLWMRDPASPKQMQALAKFDIFRSMSKIEAASNLTFFFNRIKIEQIIGVRR